LNPLWWPTGVYLLKTLGIGHKIDDKMLGGWTKKLPVMAVYCSFSGNGVYPSFWSPNDCKINKI
jgi:hypothetical protein